MPNQILQIKVANGTVELNSKIIKLDEKQIDYLNKSASRLSEKMWKSEKQKALRIKMTEEQKNRVLEWKDTLIEILSPNRSATELRKSGVFELTHHALEQIRKRILIPEVDRIKKANEMKKKLGMPLEIENLNVNTASLLEEVLDVLINSTEINPYLEWKAHPHFTFTFSGNFRGIYEIDIAISLDVVSSLVITVIVKNEKNGVL